MRREIRGREQMRRGIPHDSAMFEHQDAIRVLEGEMDVVQCNDKRLVPRRKKVEHG